MNNKKMLLLLGFFLFVIIVFNIFKNTYAYDYKDYDYTLFYKDNESELTEDIKKYISDIDYLIYNNSEFSTYETLNDNYEFMVNFAIDYISMNKYKYKDNIVSISIYSFVTLLLWCLSKYLYGSNKTIYDVTNKYFGVKDFTILNNNINIIDKYISLSGTTKNKINLEIDSASISKDNDIITADIKYKNDSETDYIYTFKINNNILKIYNVEVR